MSGARRCGLVLGSGGVLGAAWTVGALSVLEEERRLSCVDADVLMGTSAGSIVAAFLAAGVSPAEQAAHQRGTPYGQLAELVVDYALTDVRPAPLLPPSLGSPELLVRCVRRPWDLGLAPLVAGLAPRGRSSFAALAGSVHAVLPEWPAGHRLRILAMDFRTGDRRVFGGPGDTEVAPASAVSASCAVPGLFEPVTIDGRTYVDGGVRSHTSADLLLDDDLDEVFVVAPMAHYVRTNGPPTVSEFLLRRWRTPQTTRILAELAVLREAGVEVTLIAPTADDLGMLTANPMDPTRRLEVLETAFQTTRASLRRRSGRQ